MNKDQERLFVEAARSRFPGFLGRGSKVTTSRKLSPTRENCDEAWLPLVAEGFSIPRSFLMDKVDPVCFAKRLSYYMNPVLVHSRSGA